MSAAQAILTIFVGQPDRAVPMLLNAHAGTRYCIPFPVLVRASFGVLGRERSSDSASHCGCGWFGIQTRIGGEAIHAMLRIIWPALDELRSRPLGLLSPVLGAEPVGCRPRD
jgi:NCS1 family nucleobase:cation symporter-1